MCEIYKNGQMMKYDEMCSKHRSEYYGNQKGLEIIIKVGSSSVQSYSNGGFY